MKETRAARRYARAVITSAINDEQIEKLGKDIAAFSSAFESNADLKKILIHPGINLSEKKKVLTGVGEGMGISFKCLKVLEVILENGRMGILPEIAKSYLEMADEELKQVKIEVSTAHPLSASSKDRLVEIFSGITGKNARIEVSEDKSLIGGIVAKVGSIVYDGSLSNQLRSMKVKLEQEA